VLIMDSRHPLTALDLQLVDWLRPTGVPVHVLLNKSDKLTRQESIATLRDVNAALGKLGENYSAQLFSSPHRVGIVEAVAKIRNWLDLEEENKKPPV